MARLREEIRAVTLDIVHLVGNRQRLARQIGLHKELLGLPVKNRGREEDLRRLVFDECDRMGVRREVGQSLLSLLLYESERVQNEAWAKPKGVARLRRVAVVGGGGAMGTLFTRYFMERGHEVVIFDTDPEQARTVSKETGASVRASLRKAVKDVDLVLVSVPVEETPRVIQELASRTKRGSVVVEVSSLKARTVKVLREMAARGLMSLSLHPLFGPGAGTLLDQSMAVIPVLDEEKELELARELFPASKLFTVDAEAHDKAVALTVGLVYYMNVGFASVLADRDPVQLRELGGVSFRLQLLLCEALISQDPALYVSLLGGSKETSRLLSRLAQKLGQISQEGGLSNQAEWALRKRLAQDPWFSGAYRSIYRLQHLLSI